MCLRMKLFPVQGVTISQHAIHPVYYSSSLWHEHTRNCVVVALCQGKALSLNSLLVKNKCLWTIKNSVCLGICHCITVSLKQSPILQSSGSYREAGPLKGSCSSQSNSLQGWGESYIVPSPLFSILWTLLAFRILLGSQQPVLSIGGNHHGVWISRAVFVQNSTLQQDAVLAPTLTPAFARNIPLLQLAQLPKRGPHLELRPTRKSQHTFAPSLHARIERGDHQARMVLESQIPSLHL